MIYERVNWQNGAETPLNQTNLNKMDKAISELVGELERLKQLEVLGAFPNQSNSCINNCVNFSSISGFSVTYGTLDTSDGKLIVANPEYGSTLLKSKLNKKVVLNQDKTMLVKLRIKAVAGSNVVVYPQLGLSDGTTVFVTLNSIVGSNLITNSAYPKYNLPIGEWVDIWYVFGSEIDTEIESIVLHIAPYPTVEISSLQAFYSLDKGDSSGGAKPVSVVYNVDTTTTPSTPVTAEEEREI